MIFLTDLKILGLIHTLQVKISHHTQMFPLSRQMFSVMRLTLWKIFLNDGFSFMLN
jgi:hypothetical protein